MPYFLFSVSTAVFTAKKLLQKWLLFADETDFSLAKIDKLSILGLQIQAIRCDEQC